MADIDLRVKSREVNSDTKENSISWPGILFLSLLRENSSLMEHKIGQYCLSLPAVG
jgi:hypothetical protein